MGYLSFLSSIKVPRSPSSRSFTEPQKPRRNLALDTRLGARDSTEVRRRKSAPSFSLGPSNGPSRDRGELPILPAFSFRNLVLGIGNSVIAGELLSTGNGAAAPEQTAGGRPAATGLLDAPEPLDQDLRAQNRSYPFAARFL